MVMGRRPEVKTAPGPVVALDAVLLAQQMAISLARLPFRRPLQGRSTWLSNLGASTTREMVRSYMGYATSLPLAEFRSIEVLLDDLCRVVMPPIVTSFGVDHRRVEIGGVPGILYTPKDREPVGVILYLHGGGYIGTSPTMYAFFTARLCAETSCAVFVADYRLAPEFPYPAGALDAGSVLKAAIEAGVPADRLVLAGDSGGGGLCTTMALAAEDHDGLVRPAGVILFSPEVDLRMDEPSVTDNAELDILPWNVPTTPYLQGTDPTNALVSAVEADLEGFPPTCVSWGGDEMFRDAIRRFAAKLDEAGVHTHAHEVPGMFHVFQILMPWADESQAIYGHVATFVEAIFEGTPPLPDGVLDRIHELR